MSNLEVELIRHRLEQQTSVLVTKDLLLTSTTVSNYATEITIHTYIHSYIANIVVVLTTNPVLAHRQKCATWVRPKTIDQYIFVHCWRRWTTKKVPSSLQTWSNFKTCKRVHQVKCGVRDVQITPAVGQSSSVFSQTGHGYQQNLHFFDVEFLWSRSTPGTK